MTRLVCFIDKEGQVGTCTNFEIEGDCENCGFKTKYEGKEKYEFDFTAWTGELNPNAKPWYERCLECGCNTFKVKVTPLGHFATDHEWICSWCGNLVGGVICDPMNEIEGDSEFIAEDEHDV